MSHCLWSNSMGHCSAFCSSDWEFHVYDCLEHMRNKAWSLHLVTGEAAWLSGGGCAGGDGSYISYSSSSCCCSLRLFDCSGITPRFLFRKVLFISLKLIHILCEWPWNDILCSSLKATNFLSISMDGWFLIFSMSIIFYSHYTDLNLSFFSSRRYFRAASGPFNMSPLSIYSSSDTMTDDCLLFPYL